MNLEIFIKNISDPFRQSVSFDANEPSDQTVMNYLS